MRPEDLTESQARALTEWHVRHYEKMIRQAEDGVRGIRPDECEMYLAIWQDIEQTIQMGGWGNPLTQREAGEVQDAIDCGDFEELLEMSK